MIQRDYILRWAQELAKVLAILLGKDPGPGIIIIEESYDDLLQFNPNELDAITSAEWMDFLLLKRQFNEGQLDFLAHLFAKEADYHYLQQEVDKCRLRAKQALTIFDHLEVSQATFSLERQQIMDRMTRILNDSSLFSE